MLSNENLYSDCKQFNNLRPGMENVSKIDIDKFAKSANEYWRNAQTGEKVFNCDIGTKKKPNSVILQYVYV